MTTTKKLQKFLTDIGMSYDVSHVSNFRLNLITE